MKKLLLILLFITLTFNVVAQNFDRQERIKALKIAFITEKLDLTEKEAQQFWPLYNTFDDETHKLRRQSYHKREKLDINAISDQEAEDLLEKMIAAENKKIELREKFINDLLKFLPAKKIILLKHTEDAFNKRMLKEMQKRREKFNRD